MNKPTYMCRSCSCLCDVSTYAATPEGCLFPEVAAKCIGHFEPDWIELPEKIDKPDKDALYKYPKDHPEEIKELKIPKELSSETQDLFLAISVKTFNQMIEAHNMLVRKFSNDQE